MEILSEYHFQSAELVTRSILAILFIAQGFDKVFKVKISGVITTFADEMQHKNIPHFILVLAAYFTSFSELLGGLFLLVGFMKSFALMLLGLDLILVSIAFSILQPMWDMKFVFPRIVLLVFLLLLPNEIIYWTIDNLLKNI